MKRRHKSLSGSLVEREQQLREERKKLALTLTAAKANQETQQQLKTWHAQSVTEHIQKRINEHFEDKEKIPEVNQLPKYL